jgi:hypothetical protein
MIGRTRSASADHSPLPALEVDPSSSGDLRSASPESPAPAPSLEEKSELDTLKEQNQMLFQLLNNQSDVLATIKRAQDMSVFPPVSSPTSSAAPISVGVKGLKPQTFTGQIHTVTKWLFHINNYFKLIHVSKDSEKIDIAGMLFKEYAFEWYQEIVTKHLNNPTDPSYCIKTWEQFSQMLLDEFQPINAEEVAREKLFHIRQKNNVSQYVSEIRRLFAQIPSMDEKTRIDFFLKGLRSHPVRIKVKEQQPEKFIDAAAAAQRADVALYGASDKKFTPRLGSRFGSSGGTSDTPYPRMKLEGSLSNITGDDAERTYEQVTDDESGGTVHMVRGRRLTPQEREKLRREGRCYNCHQPGHRFFECKAFPADKSDKPKNL